MNHFIAMNPQRGGNKGSASYLPLAEYDKLIAQPWLHDMVEQIRGGNDKLKGLMPFRCGHYSRFLKNHRSQKDADPTSFLFQTTIDIDDKELVGIAIEMARQLNCSDSIWKGMLLHLEYSARKKLHIDIRMPIGMTIEETQRAYCKALGVPCDESCFTPERILFITDQDSEIYRSKDWYAVLPADEPKARREAYLKRGLTIDGRGKAVSHGSAIQPAQPGNSPTFGTASEKSLIAFDLFTESAGLKNVNIDTEGTYPLLITKSPRFKQWLPLLQGVPGFEGIRIHAGNYPDDTQGCILPGENKLRGMVVNSRILLHRLVNAITAARDRGESIWITIV